MLAGQSIDLQSELYGDALLDCIERQSKISDFNGLASSELFLQAGLSEETPPGFGHNPRKLGDEDEHEPDESEEEEDEHDEHAGANVTLFLIIQLAIG